MTSIKIQQLDPRATLPSYASAGASGLDLSALEATTIEPGRWKLIPTGLAIEVPPGFEGQIRPRSGLAARKGLTVLNAPGTIDSDYRGELKIALINHGPMPVSLAAGARMAQLVICPVERVEVELVDGRLSSTDRGSGGFGSTGS